MQIFVMGDNTRFTLLSSKCKGSNYFLLGGSSQNAVDPGYLDFGYLEEKI